MGINSQSTKIIILTNCTKNKLTKPAPAGILYQGQTFKMIRKLSQTLHSDLLILSAKYGLIAQHDVISPYDQVIKSSSEALKLWQESGKRFLQYLESCDKMICFLSKRYLMYLRSILPHPKIVVIQESKGILGYNELLFRLQQKPVSQIEYYLMNFENNKHTLKQASLLSFIRKKARDHSLFDYVSNK
jgi:hypothetical protein